MKLIVGLGNPGSKYQRTRHNVGYMALDEYQRQNNFDFKLVTKLEGEIAIINNGDDKVVFLKPTTFMNESGRSISKVMNYYKITIDDVLIIYDDVSLAVGKLRLRPQGSAGGHNGIKSIIAHLGSNFTRVRIGIGENPYDLVDYVLGNFSVDDLCVINQALAKVTNIITLYMTGMPFEKIMNQYNIS